MNLAYEKLNSIPGVSCVKPKGALYLFPKIDLTQFKQINTKGGIDGGLYSNTTVIWKLTGAKSDIIAHNELEIYKASKIVPSVGYAIKNYLEYARITLV